MQAGFSIFKEVVLTQYPEPMLCEADLQKFIAASAGDEIYYSDKEDGVRCLVDPVNGVYSSRNGKPFPNFGVFTPVFRELASIIGIPGALFDGEVTADDGSFTSVMTQVHRLHEVDSSFLRFNVFDVIVPGAFKDRLGLLQRAFASRRYHNVRLHPHIRLADGATTESIQLLLEGAWGRGKEGLVLKLGSSVYVSGRSVAWCKLKKSDTLDLPVKGVEEGKGKLAGKVGKFICDYNGVTVKVAPGKLSHDELENCFIHPPKLIEVEYQEVTSKGSLRHPRCIRIREDKE